MNRRSFLAALGVAPVAVAGGVIAHVTVLNRTKDSVVELIDGIIYVRPTNSQELKNWVAMHRRAKMRGLI